MAEITVNSVEQHIANEMTEWWKKREAMGLAGKALEIAEYVASLYPTDTALNIGIVCDGENIELFGINK